MLLRYGVASFIIQRECNANNNYRISRSISLDDSCGKTIVRRTINAGINNIIYMGLISGPKIANGKCGKTMDRGSTVYLK
jgi:hypothetical protein